jgi:hypothetical protein
MVRWKLFIVSVVAAALAAGFVTIDMWDNVKQALLVALSVLAAAVLVRLARGLPFTNADQFEVEEIKALTKAVQQIMRSLRLLIFVILATMLLIALAKPILDRVIPIAQSGWIPIYVRAAISFTLGLLLSYIFIRIRDVVHGDYDLVNLQSNYMVRAVERKSC